MKLWSHATISLMRLIQAVGVVGFAAFFLTGGTGLSWQGALWSLPALALGSVLLFYVSACLESVAFWADNVWSLTILMRILTFILGCGAFPLEFFPDAMQSWLVWLPFHAFSGFPVRAALGQLSWGEYLQGLAIGMLWLVIAWWVLQRIWNRGLRTYSAVGM
jgi:ABC-2 type transport system permease protein